MDDTTVKLLDIFATVILGLVGAYFTYNFNRQIKLKVVERRLGAYSELWSLTETASPTRLKDWREHPGPSRGPLSDKERIKIYKEVVAWYYHKGNGMLLGGRTRNLFLAIKDNLVCPNTELKPNIAKIALEKIEASERLTQHEKEKENSKFRGELSIRQLSLLRTRLKADLEVYGVHYFGNLDDYQKQFLIECGENMGRKPWKRLGPRKVPAPIE